MTTPCCTSMVRLRSSWGGIHGVTTADNDVSLGAGSPHVRAVLCRSPSRRGLASTSASPNGLSGQPHSRRLALSLNLASWAMMLMGIAASRRVPAAWP